MGIKPVQMGDQLVRSYIITIFYALAGTFLSMFVTSMFACSVSAELLAKPAADLVDVLYHAVWRRSCAKLYCECSLSPSG